MNTKFSGFLLWIAVVLGITVMSGLSAVLPVNAQSPAPTPMSPSIKDVPPEMILTGALPDLPDDLMIIEGDIQIRKDDFERRYLAAKNRSNGEPVSPQGGYEDRPQHRLWTNGVFPYEFNANVSAANQTAMQQAMALWQGLANVQFNQCQANSCAGDFVVFQASANSNNSWVGRLGGRQVINIVSWNSLAIMAHELGHALGLVHEQSRRDREDGGFVRINYNNVCKATDMNCLGGFCFDNAGNRIDCDFNFDIESNSLTYGSYDFDSVMHYERDAFSRNGNDTITVLPPHDVQWQNAIGQRTHLSVRDQNVMGCIYPRNTWRWVSTAAGSPFNGTCRQPYSTIATGVNNAPPGGTLWIEPGSYTAAGTYTKQMTLQAPNGSVTLR